MPAGSPADGRSIIDPTRSTSVDPDADFSDAGDGSDLGDAEDLLAELCA
jgi:hypothetical protein